MQQLVFEAATLCGLGAAALAALVMIGNGAGLTSLLVRTMTIGGSVFLFAILGGQIIGRMLLETIAKKELEEAKAVGKENQETGLKDARAKIVSMQPRFEPKRVETSTTSEDTVSSNAA